MNAASLSIIAPGLIQQTWTEAEAFGSAVWLWMHSQFHRDTPLHALSPLLLPAIKHRQFLVASEAGRPVFYMAWANFSEEAERRYLSRHPADLPDSDWNSGDRMWILDWIAPFGHTRDMKRLVEKQLFANRFARTLDHRGDERGLKVKTLCGGAVLPAQAKAWFDQHPVALPAQPQATPSRMPSGTPPPNTNSR